MFFVRFGIVNSRVADVATLFQDRRLASRFSTTYCMMSLPPLSLGGCQWKIQVVDVMSEMERSSGADGLSV